MHRYRAPSIAPGRFFVAQSWADFIINMSESNLRQAQHTTPIRRVWKAGLSRDPVQRALAQHGREASCTQGPWTLQQVNSALEAVNVGGGRDARRSAAEDGMRPIAPVWRGLA